jgi:hypothetical protein
VINGLKSMRRWSGAYDQELKVVAIQQDLKSDIGVIRRDFYSFLAHGVIEMLATN